MRSIAVGIFFILAMTLGYIPGASSVEPAPPPGKKAGDSPPGPVSPPMLDGATEVDYLAVVRLINVPPETPVFWDVSPEDKVETIESECNTGFAFAGEAGKYKVKARGFLNGKKFDLQKTITIKKGGNPPVPPVPPVPPIPPVPPTPPVPPIPPIPPEPIPVSKVSYFVVVEDTSKAGAWRGDILGSPKVSAWYQTLQGKTSDPVHRLISLNGEGVDTTYTPEMEKFIGLAKGKDLPWLFLLDANKKIIKDMKAPIVPDEFIAAVGDIAPHKRAMGNNPPNRKLKATWKTFGTAPQVPLIERSSWKKVDLSAFLPAVKDQDGIGACNAFATIEATEAARKQAGLKYVRLSPGYLYGNINGGSDSGSLLEDGLSWMMDHGTCSTATVPDLDWRHRPASAATEAKSYKVVEAYVCPDFDAMASALQQGFFIVEGLMWYDNFNPDRDGWLPARGAGGVGGHALCGYGLVQRNGVWGIMTRNSWGPSWGVGGNCVIPETLFGQQIGGFWAIRSVTQTPTDFSNVSEAEDKHRKNLGKLSFVELRDKFRFNPTLERNDWALIP